MPKKVCIICKQEKDGTPISDDPVIRTIRTIKRKFGIAQNNQLIVCAECMPKHKAKRTRFEKYVVIYAIFAVASFLLLLYVSPSINGLFSGIGMALIILAMSLFIYTPATAKA